VACDKHRVSSKQPLIRRSPNGTTHSTKDEYLVDEYIGYERRTEGTETSKYLEEKTSIEIPLVVASERGIAQKFIYIERNTLESVAIEGDSPVRERYRRMNNE